MATNYPGSLDTFDTIGASDEMNDEVGTRTHREMHNDANDAIEAIEAELGTNPSGAYDTVAARLASVDVSTLLVKANNLSDLASASTARTNLGLGTAAVANTGTGASNVILGNDARLTDTRTPSAASIVNAMIASTLSPSKITGTAAILGANTFTAQQFIDGSSDQIQLRVQGVAGQSANAITVEDSSASVLASISAAGAITGTSLRASSSTAALMLGTSGAQSDRRAITNTYWGYSNSYRAILLGSASTNYNITDGASTIAINYDPSINAWGGFTGDGGEMIVRRGLTVCVPNSGDTSFKKTMTWRDGFVGINQTAPTSGLQIQPPDAASIGLRVLGFAAQTASLQTWESSAGSVLASVSAAGLGTFAGLTSTADITTAAGYVMIDRSGDATHATIYFQRDAGNSNQIIGRTGSSNRWMLRIGNATAETGTNAGSDLDFLAYQDDGATYATPLSITRATGVATFLNQVKVGASTTTRSSLNVPHGTAPASPVDGDMWTTTAGLYVRINGATVGPLS